MFFDNDKHPDLGVLFFRLFWRIECRDSVHFRNNQKGYTAETLLQRISHTIVDFHHPQFRGDGKEEEMEKIFLVWCRSGFQGSDGWADMSHIIGAVAHPEDAGTFAREHYTRELKEMEAGRPLQVEERAAMEEEIKLFSSFINDGGIWVTDVSGRARLKLEEIEVWSPPTS